MTDDPTLARRLLPDGREASVVPLTFGRARIVVGPPNAGWIDSGY